MIFIMDEYCYNVDKLKKVELIVLVLDYDI